MLQNILDDMAGLEGRILGCAPMGYALAINIRGFTPEFYLTTYPDEWVKIYHHRRYALFDPATIWSRFHEGRIRWSERILRAATVLPLQTRPRWRPTPNRAARMRCGRRVL